MNGDRRPALIAAAVALALILAGGGYAIGRATAPEDQTAPAAAAAQSPPAIRNIGGVAVGVRRSRAGALSAADNYVATATQTAVQNPEAYRALVLQAYAPVYRATAMIEARDTRARSPRLTALYAEGGKTVITVFARRLDSYDGANASVTAWVGGATWGGPERSQTSWDLIELNMVWERGRWLVTRLDGADRPAPTPAVVGSRSADSRTNAAFERELRGMSGPTYGGG